MNPEASLDIEVFGAAMREFGRRYMEVVPAITASWSVGITMVNHRVTGYSLHRGKYVEGTWDYHELGLTAPRPIAHQ